MSITVCLNTIYSNKNGLLCLFLFLTVSCTKHAERPLNISDTSTNKTTTILPQVNFLIPAYNPVEPDTTKTFDNLPVVNPLIRQDLVEISGVAASRTNPGILYIHNDSGNSAQVYLTDVSGADKGTLSLTTIGNRDWEDIAVGPGPVAGQNYIYIADIGDNNIRYSSVFVYRFPEPDLTGKILPYTANITNVDAIELKYPDGPRNAETLMVDPLTKDIYIASKENNLSKIYVARYPQSTLSATLLTPVVQLYFNKATGGDISSDGTEILLRNNQLIWYWKLSAGTAITSGLSTKPQIAPYANNEPQGEGISFAADGSGYYTTTEVRDYPGKPATLSFYKRK